MSEELIRIQGADDNGIYGIHCKGGNERLVVHLHGMTHGMNHLLEVTSSEFFEEHDYDHYRINFYSSAIDSRKLSNSTLSTHVSDIKSVIGYFRDSYKEIFVSAHSLSGLAMLIANPEGIKAMSLWDPSTDVTNFWATAPYLDEMRERDEYRLDYGNTFVIGRDIVDEIKQYPDDRCRELAAKIKTPMQFIIPEESIFMASPHISPEAYAQEAKGPFDLKRIDDADHVFSKRGNRQKLFAHTLAFFKQHSLG